ncbi:MAG TPA: phosphotransferase [Marmoricola sp.]|nr:phosphotransferase [Marmoricola sp.]
MTSPFGIDVALPGLDAAEVAQGLDRLSRPPDWLTAIEDPQRLRDDLESSVPELASGAVRLVSCKFKRAYVDGPGWQTLCRLMVEDATGATPRQVDVHGYLAAPGVDVPPTAADSYRFGADHRYSLPDPRPVLDERPPDDGLPALAVLADRETARSVLERALRTSRADLADLQLAGCTPTVMRHREGRRCTIRYELDYRPELRQPHWPLSIVAKLYGGEEARTTYTGMTALWDSPLRRSSTVRIAEPLALVPELDVMVQSTLPGDHTLKDEIRTAFAAGLDAGIATLADPVRRAGRGLAELHGSQALSGSTVTWTSRVAALRDAVDQLDAAVPSFAGALHPLIRTLEVAAANVPAQPLVATHGSFRPAQILLDNGNLGFLDFDGCCQAEPGVDLALFRTTLCDLSLRALTLDDRRPLTDAEGRAAMDGLDGLCATFLSGYQEVCEIAPDRLALWDALTSAKDIVDCWRKIKFEHLERRLAFIRRRLAPVSR